MPSRQDNTPLKEYLQRHVVEALEADNEDGGFNRRKALFLLDEFPVERGSVELVEYADGKVDAFAIDEDTTGETVISVYQLSGPDENNIRAGSVKAPPGRKLYTDLTGLAETMRHGQRVLSDDGADAVVAIRDKVIAATAAGHTVRLQLFILSLYNVSAAQAQDISERAQVSLRDVFPGATLDVECIVHGLREYSAAHRGDTRTVVNLPNLELELASPEGFAVYGRSYLAFAKPLALLVYYRTHRAALLSSNARFYLGSTRSASTNVKIEATARDPRGATRFHELNNGLVITCTDIRARGEGRGTSLVLRNPQVVNGGQTLHSLSRVHQSSASSAVSPLYEVVIPVKIVRVDGVSSAEDAETIASASNTQTALSPRALASYATTNARLQRAFAHLPFPWFLEKTDGEENAFRTGTDAFRRSTTGREHVSDFIAPGGSLANGRMRKVTNVDLMEAVVSAYGCFNDSKKQQLFSAQVHPDVLETVLTADGWESFQRETRPKQNVTQWKEYPVRMLPHAPPSFLWLTWCLLKATKNLVQSEAKVRRWIVDSAVQYGFMTSAPVNYAAWSLYAEQDASSTALTFEWAEHIANSMQKPLVFEMLRLLARRYGELDELTSARILRLPQLVRLFEGERFDRVLDRRAARAAPIGDAATPVYTLFQLGRHACGILSREHGSEIRRMGTRQQELLRDEWVQRLSAQVDGLATAPQLRQHLLLIGGRVLGAELSELLPALPPARAADAASEASTDVAPISARAPSNRGQTARKVPTLAKVPRKTSSKIAAKKTSKNTSRRRRST